MRKILLTLALVFASAASYAQTEWYVQANLSLNKYTHEDIDGENSRMPGYEALVGFFKPMGSDMFLWGMNLGVANRGEKYYDVYDVKESRFMAEFSPLRLQFPYSDWLFSHRRQPTRWSQLHVRHLR